MHYFEYLCYNNLSEIKNYSPLFLLFYLQRKCMINRFRQINTLLFSLEQDIILEKVVILKGFNQIRNHGKFYNIYRLDNLHIPYAIIDSKQMALAMSFIFPHLIDDERIDTVDSDSISTKKDITISHIQNTIAIVNENFYINFPHNISKHSITEKNMNI